jgi:HEAT repeat protein
MTVIAEFRPLIESVIPEIVNLLKNSNQEVRRAGTYTLCKLSGRGETANFIGSSLLMKIIEEFQRLIGTTIPEIVDLLKHNNRRVREAGADILSELSEQSKTANLWGLTLLMRMIAKFRSLIIHAIPVIVDLLKDDDLSIRITCVNALSTFSAQGKTDNLSDLFANDNHS